MRAVLLAGGRASRLGGIDKPALEYRGLSLLEHALAATDGADRVVVGAGAVPAGVPTVLEEPRWGGPVAALAAGLAALPPRPEEVVAVLAADQPHVADALPRLRAAVEGTADGWVAVDEERRRQPLLAIYREDALRRALTGLGDLAGLPLRRVLDRLAIVEVPLPSELCSDVDTAEDVRRLGIRAPGEDGP
ncbi:molybdenum cofactor guanylyltransferase [Naasia sp. SYSU D00948]|uniref:molybdenum cofactor guanylyltransferase n=1 Tax=Naasia sp. SYSU D00948 TaxID=2817379 RepID=UPI001B30700A|nr:NTP transferase domain-containing protein [Naasia sp. SYSU D00948]